MFQLIAVTVSAEMFAAADANILLLSLCGNVTVDLNILVPRYVVLLQCPELCLSLASLFNVVLMACQLDVEVLLLYADAGEPAVRCETRHVTDRR